MKIIKVVDTDGLRLLKGKMDIMKVAMKELAEEMKKVIEEVPIEEYNERLKEFREATGVKILDGKQAEKKLDVYKIELHQAEVIIRQALENIQLYLTAILKDEVVEEIGKQAGEEIMADLLRQEKEEEILERTDGKVH